MVFVVILQIAWEAKEKHWLLYKNQLTICKTVMILVEAYCCCCNENQEGSV